jgi:cyclic pyranopterin phosphate synthase
MEGQCQGAGSLVDPQGREIKYLRLSLTDKCNFRCVYCSPSSFDGNSKLLGRAEISRLVGLFAKLGVKRVRLTGGEPTVRPDITAIVADIAATPGIEEVAITTNGFFFENLALPLRRAGLSAVNFSLDTLDANKLASISGDHAHLGPVLRGFDAAAGAGFRSLKLNTVVMKGVNDGELGALVRHAWSRGATPRFIELMPFTDGVPVPTREVIRLLGDQGLTLVPDPHRGWGPAHYLRGESGKRVGFISPMTENFCEGCNRIRLGPDGALRACLGGQDEVSLRDLLRAGADDERLTRQIWGALMGKGERHHMGDRGVVLLSMMKIGG